MKLRIWEIIRFSQHKSLNICFTEKTRNDFKRGPFVSLEELYSYSFCFLERKKKHISSLCGFQGEKPKYLSGFSGREFCLFIFNSDSFWVVLKLPETNYPPPFSPINLVWLSQPTWAPKSNSNNLSVHLDEFPTYLSRSQGKSPTMVTS